MSTTNVLVSTFAPFKTLSLNVPESTSIGDLYSLLSAREPMLPVHQLRLSHASAILDLLAPISSYGEGQVNLRLAPSMLGGKGGFGSQLRAAGGRMSSRKTGNTDSCRDLSGRRLGTIKQAEKLAAYMEAEPQRLQAQADAKKAKLEALERRLGIDKDGSQDKAAAGQKRRFDDTKFMEQSQEIVEGVRDAVAAGFLKKRKKAKIDQSTTPPVEEPVASPTVTAAA